MVGTRDVVSGDMMGQCQFHLVGRVVVLGYQSQTMGDAIDMGVDGQGLLAEGDAEDDVGGLPTYTGQVE